MSTTRPSSWTQSLGLVLAGFLVGIIVANINRSTSSQDRPAVAAVDQDVYSEAAGSYRKIAQTGVWDVLIDSSAQGRSVALGQGGDIRVVVIDDKSALYVMTYKPDDPVWQGRLMDVGNDGTVEVADLSYGHCEAFTPR